MIKNEQVQQKRRKESVKLFCQKKNPRSRLLDLKTSKASLLFLLFLVISTLVLSTTHPVKNNNPFVEWDRTLDGVFLKALITSDNNILVVGNNNGLFFSKYDLEGNLLWLRYIHPENNNQPFFDGAPQGSNHNFQIWETSDGGFLMVWMLGYTGQVTKASIYRTDQNGIILWSKDPLRSSIHWYRGYVTKTTKDELLFVLGYTDAKYGDYPPVGNPLIESNNLLRILKISITGEISLNITGTATQEYVRFIVDTPDEGYILEGQKILGGYSLEYPSTTLEYFDDRIIHTLDKNGREEWNETIEGWTYTTTRSTPWHKNDIYDGDSISLDDDGILLLGQYGNHDTGLGLKIVKINFQGELVYNFQIKEEYKVIFVDSYIDTSDNGLILVYSVTDISRMYSVGDCGQETRFLKLDQNGNVEWTIPSKMYDRFSSQILEITPGKFLISGAIPTWKINTDYRIPSDYILKTDVELVLIDNNGFILWNETYDKAEIEGILNILRTSDNGIVLAGRIGEDFWYGDNHRIWVFKLDFSTGNVIW